MLYNIISIIIVSIFLVLVLSSTPLNIGLWIIFSTLIISISITISIQSWFPIILFLIYVGGLLVIFAYFVSIQPNQQLIIIKIITIIILTFSIFIPTSLNYSSSPTPESINKQTILELLSIYNIQTLIFLALILFLALVAVVKITKIYIGPLRPFN